MLLVETYVAPSGIHGMGCFANEFIPKGTRVFQYDRRVDRSFKESRLSRFPKPFERFVRFHAYVVKSWGSRYFVLPGDNDRHMNHSDTPNIVENHAACDINVGDELTCDYWWVEDDDAPYKRQDEGSQEPAQADKTQVSI